MRYRKKPVIIEAIQLRWDTWSEMCDHASVGKLEDGKPQGRFGPNNTIELLIPTLEGLMTASENDWVIKGINGEVYPCKPDIFDKTYEEIPRGEVMPTVPELLEELRIIREKNDELRNRLDNMRTMLGRISDGTPSNGRRAFTLEELRQIAHAALVQDDANEEMPGEK